MKAGVRRGEGIEKFGNLSIRTLNPSLERKEIGSGSAGSEEKRFYRREKEEGRKKGKARPKRALCTRTKRKPLASRPESARVHQDEGKRRKIRDELTFAVTIVKGSAHS